MRLTERTPRQIIGDDAYMQLVFEGYEVVKASSFASSQEEIARLRKALEPLEPFLSVEFSHKVADDRRITIGVSGAAISLCTKMTVGDFRTAARALSGERDNG